MKRLNHAEVVEEVKDEVVEAEDEVREEVVVLKEEEEVMEEAVVEEMVVEEVEEELLLVVVVMALTPVSRPAKDHNVMSIQGGLVLVVVDVVAVVEDLMMVVDVVVDEFHSVLELERGEGRMKFNRGEVL